MFLFSIISVLSDFSTPYAFSNKKSSSFDKKSYIWLNFNPLNTTTTNMEQSYKNFLK